MTVHPADGVIDTVDPVDPPTGTTPVDTGDVDSRDTQPAGTLVPPRSRRRRRRRVIVAIGLAVLLLGGGATAWALTRDTTSTATTYRTTTVATQTLKSTVSGTGSLDPARQADLTFSASGTVTSVKVEVGDKVTKGQTLATIDDATLQIAYTQAKSALAEAKSALADVEDDSSATDAELAAAKATVTLDKTELAAAKKALAGAKLKATFAGTVAAVGIATGDTAGSSSSGGSSQSTSSSSSAITVITTGTFTVDTSVSNSDVTSIKKGLQATITPTGASTPVYGTVTAVGVVASGSSSSTTTTTTSGSSTFPVSIKVTGTHTDLLPGSSVSVEITTKQLTDVIAVPTQAITTTDGATVVQKLVDGKQVATPVTLGAVLGTQTVITEGLAVGDQVVVASFTAQPGSGSTRSGQDQGYGGQGTQGGPPDQQGGQGGAPGGTQGGTGAQGGGR